MTDREKIAQIIAEYLCPQGKSHKTLYGAARMCYSYNNFADCEKVSECVDALIKAGIGDVKETVKDFKKKITVLRKGIIGIEHTDFWQGYKKAKYEAIEIIKQAEKELAEEERK